MQLNPHPRVIPVLLIKDGSLVKPFRFARPTYLGDPLNALRIFNEKEVDEVAIIDIGASRGGPDFVLLERMVSEAFMPLTFGGGIRSIEVAKSLFRLGFDKIGVEGALRDNPDMVSEIATVFGSQSLVGMVTVRASLGKMVLHFPEKRKTVAQKLAELEAGPVGEVLVSFSHLEGTREGLPLGFLRDVVALSSKPVVAVGGVGSLDHIRSAAALGLSGIGAGTFFCLYGERRSVLISYPDRDELDGLSPQSVQRALMRDESP